jgi:hypothetical protein
LEEREPARDADARIRPEGRPVMEDRRSHIAGLLGELTEAPFARRPREPRARQTEPEPPRLLQQADTRRPQVPAQIRGAQRHPPLKEGLEQTTDLQR